MQNQLLVFIVAILIATLFFTACDKPSDTYFPLRKGLTWEYHVASTTPYYNKQDTLKIKNLGKKKIEGRDLYLRRTSFGTDYYFAKELQNVNRVAKRTTIELKPRFDEEDRYVIKTPIEPGTSWAYQGKPYLLDRPFPTDYELHQTVRFLMTYRIIAVDEEVATPAGMFENCLHIQGTAEVDIGRTLTLVSDHVEFTTDEWYAKGIGLVKLVRFEDVDTEYAYGGTIEMSLVDFDR